jgi:hypothetical protein
MVFMLRVLAPAPGRLLKGFTPPLGAEGHRALAPHQAKTMSPVANQRGGDQALLGARRRALLPGKTGSPAGQGGGNHATGVAEARQNPEWQDGLGAATGATSAALDRDNAHALVVTHAPEVAAPQRPTAAATAPARATAWAGCYAGRGASSLASGARAVRSGGSFSSRQSRAAQAGRCDEAGRVR